MKGKIPGILPKKNAQPFAATEQIKKDPSALAAASGSGEVLKKCAILHNEFIVNGEANPAGMHYNDLLCNIALVWFKN